MSNFSERLTKLFNKTDKDKLFTVAKDDEYVYPSDDVWRHKIKIQ